MEIDTFGNLSYENLINALHFFYLNQDTEQGIDNYYDLKEYIEENCTEYAFEDSIEYLSFIPIADDMTPEQQSDLDVSYCTIHDKNGVKLGWV
jgi:hypothetical protein